MPTVHTLVFNVALVASPYIPGSPYVGSAEAIAQQLQEVIEAEDFDGFVLTFPDFIEDLRFFGERVLPLLAAAGFAQPLGQAA